MLLENGMETCNCPRSRCERHGKCAECMEHHKNEKHPPYCKRVKVKNNLKKQP